MNNDLLKICAGIMNKLDESSHKDAKAQKAMNRMFSGKMPKKERAQKKVRKQAMGDVPGQSQTPHKIKKAKRMGEAESPLKSLIKTALMESNKARRAHTKAAKIKAGVKKPTSKALQSVMKGIADSHKAKGNKKVPSAKSPGQISKKGAPDKTSKSGRIAGLANDEDRNFAKDNKAAAKDILKNPTTQSRFHTGRTNPKHKDDSDPDRGAWVHDKLGPRK